MHPQELRQEAIQAYNNKEGTSAQLGERFGVTSRTLFRWLERDQNPPESIKMGRPVRFQQEELAFLKQLKEANPEWSLTRLAQEYASARGEPVPAHETIRDAVQKLGYSYHRNQTRRTRSTEERPSTPIKTEKEAHRYQERHRSQPKHRAKSRKAYPSDMSDAQWKLLEPLFEKEETRGRKRKVPLRELLDAMFFILRTGCQWRYLPHDFPKWTLVAKSFYRWKKKGLWLRIHTTLRENTRESAGREATPSACIIDSQSVKTTEVGGTKGFDAGKK